MKKLFLMCILCMVSLAGQSPEYKALYIQQSDAIIHASWGDLRLLFKKYGIKHQSIIEAQIRLETGHLKSVLSKTNRNLFGMRYAPQRTTTAIGELYNHALYKSYEDCIRDYSLWQGLYYKGGDYYSFLASIGYAEDKTYIAKLKKMENIW